MVLSSTFLESSLNFLSNNVKINYKIWYSQGEKRCQNLNFQKHSICNLLVIYRSNFFYTIYTCSLESVS